MSELKPYRVVMYGHETTLMLDADDAKVWGVADQAVDDEPVDLHDPDTVAAAEQALAVAAAEVAEKQKALEDEAAAKVTADLVEQQAEPAPKARPAPRRNKARPAPEPNK